MNTHWKIFNIVNLICIILIVGFFSVNLYLNPFPIDRPSDNFFYVALVLIILVVTANCLHNIFLTKFCAASERMKVGRKVFFWILLILFAGIISFFVYLAYDEINHQLKYYTHWHNFRLNYLLQFLSISATGLYISGAQVALFFRIKRSYRQGLDNFVDEIGS